MRRNASSVLRDLEIRVARLERSASISIRYTISQSTGQEMVSMIESEYGEYGLDEDFIEIEAQSPSRATGSYYYLVSLEGYYGVVRVDGRRQDVEAVSDDYRSIKRMYDSQLGR